MNNAKTIDKNLNRLKKIHELVTSNKIGTIQEMYKAIGGSSSLYTLLTKDGIVQRDTNGCYVWNDKIPITITLARSITNKVKNYNNKYVIKQSVTPSVPQKKKNRASKKVNAGKPSYRFQLAWGLITFERN